MSELLEKSWEKRWFFFFTFYVFLINFQHIYSYRNISYLSGLIALINIGFLFFLIRNEDRESLRAKIVSNLSWMEIIFWVMIVFIDLSKVVHLRFNLIVIPFIIFGRILPTYIDEADYMKIVQINLIGILPFILHPLYGWLNYPSYYNNSMGVLLTIASYFVLVLLHDALENRQKKELFLSLLYLIVTMTMTYLTGSRTAMMTSFFLVLYFSYHLVKDRIGPLTVKKAVVIILVFALLIYLNRNLIQTVYETNFLKWNRRGIVGFDFTFTGRTDTWAYTLRNANFLGGGEFFFRRFNNLAHGHNILFNMLGFYGVIPFIAMSIILVYLIYIFIKVEDLNVRLFILLFISINAFEGSIANYKASYFELLFFLHFALLMNALKNKKDLQNLA